jgi:hypothetical protein
MDFIEYPNTGYNSYCDEDFADEFFETRSNSSEWDTAAKEISLMTAFRSLKELNFNITFNDDKVISTYIYTTAEATEILQNLREAQLEQCIYELQNDLDTMQLSYLNISGLAVKMPDKQPDRFSPRALAILRPYLIAKTVTRFR